MALTREQVRQLRREPLLMKHTNKVRRARELAKLTQVELAAALGIAQGRVSKIETGPSETLELGTARQVANYFGVPIEMLFPGPDAK
jgi:transcriptional regulator with XRE-family HTH domain